jgi:hypothetical protein
MMADVTTSSIPSKCATSALQMGPCKKRKLFLLCRTYFIDSSCHSALHQILLYCMGATLVEQCSHSATIPLYLPMASSDWNKWKKHLWKTSLLSEKTSFLSANSWNNSFGSEWQEHHVFEQLLDSYPGLLEQLRNGLEEEILHVGELVCCCLGQQNSCLQFLRLAREHQVQDVTTLNPWSLQYSIGFPQKELQFSLLYIGIQRSIVASTMNLLAHYFVLLGWTGMTQSMLSFCGVCSPDNSTQDMRETPQWWNVGLQRPMAHFLVC